MTVTTTHKPRHYASLTEFRVALGDSICQAIVHNDLKALKR